MKKTSLFISILLLSFSSFAQTPNIEITPDKDNWTYELGQSPQFTIKVTSDGKPLKGVKIKYTFSQEKMPVLLSKDTVLANGICLISAKGLESAGFMTCRVMVDDSRGKAAAMTQVGFAPHAIVPMTNMPSDFEQYWGEAITLNSKLPLNTVMTPNAEYSTDAIDCYDIRIDNTSAKSYIFGSLAIPKSAEKLPVVLCVPGAGVFKQKPNVNLAKQGVITLSIDIHGIGNDLPEQTYKILSDGALKNYQFNNLDIRNEYYYKKVFLGCVKAIDFLCTLPQADKERIAVSGGSQGGALAIVTTALDKRIKYMVCFYPAMCDHVAYLHNRAGGWPHMFDKGRQFYRTADRVVNSKYYDAANFARLISVPGFYSWGYNDPTCPVTSMYSAYNVVSAPKELLIELPNGHTRSKMQNQRSEEWLLERLGVK